MTRTYIAEDTLYVIFETLRRGDTPLGVAEYKDALKILKDGVWIGEDSPKDDISRLKHMLTLLWAKSEEDARRLDELFSRFALLSETEGPDPKPENGRKAGEQEQLSSGEIGLTQFVSGKEEPGDSPANAAHDIRYDFSDIGKPAFHLTPRYPVSRRRMAGSFRRLRRMKREGVSREPDIRETIEQICRYGRFTGPVFAPKRRNQADLLLLVDRHGSMDPFGPLVKSLIEGVQHGGMLRNVLVYYFQNCPQAMLFTSPDLTSPVPVNEAVTEKLENFYALIVSDAGAARGYYQEERIMYTKRFLERLKICRRCAWLNPVPRERWEAATAEAVAGMVPMFPLDRDGLEDIVKAL